MHTRAYAVRLFAHFLLLVGFLGSPWAQAQDAAKSAPAAPLAPAAEAEPTPAQINHGLNLFLGTARFSAGGPSCNTCHNVVHDAVVGGGTLAIDLTKSYGRLDADGIMDTLPRKGAPSPFPVMQAAFQGKDITAEEGQALSAFLRHAHEQRASQKPNDLSNRMVLAGVVGVVVLLLLFAVIGQGRKRKSVNQDIYDRQVTSE